MKNLIHNVKKLFKDRNVELTQEERLFVLLSGQSKRLTSAPKKRLLGDNWLIITIGIGNDETADLFIHKNGVKALEEIIGAKL